MRNMLTTTPRYIIVVLAVIAIAWLIPGLSLSAQKMTEPTRSPSSSLSLNQIATDSVEDTLKACLARIPKNASDGQRLMAEQTCQGEASARKMDNTTF